MVAVAQLVRVPTTFSVGMPTESSARLRMKAYVYILKSVKTEKYYIGCTFDYNKRLKEHNSGFSASTKSMRPWKIMFTQTYSTLSEARKIELWIKKQKSKEFVEKLIKEGTIKKKFS